MNQSLINLGVYEDNLDLLSVISKIINSDNRFRLLISKDNIDSIISEIKEHNLNAIILDLSINNENAFLLISQIKSTFSNLFLIVYTGYYEKEIINLSKKAGANMIFDKGTDIKVILDEISKQYVAR